MAATKQKQAGVGAGSKSSVYEYEEEFRQLPPTPAKKKF